MIPITGEAYYSHVVEKGTAAQSAQSASRRVTRPSPVRFTEAQIEQLALAAHRAKRTRSELIRMGAMRVAEAILDRPGPTSTETDA